MGGDGAHGLGVGAVGSKLEGDGAEHAQLGGHLLHPAQASLLLRVGKLHHQAGRGTLGRAPHAVRGTGRGELSSPEPQDLARVHHSRLGLRQGSRHPAKRGDFHPALSLRQDVRETRKG